MVEFTIAMTSVVIGLLSYVGSVIASSRMQLDTRARVAANIEMSAAIEEFREMAARDFSGTVLNLNDEEIRDGLSTVDGIKVHRQVILDETKTQPAMDLNGDGDTSDTNLNPDDVQAVVLLTKVKWIGQSGEQSVSWPTVIARGEVDPNWRRERAFRETTQPDGSETTPAAEPTFEAGFNSGGKMHGAFTVGGTDPSHVIGLTVFTEVPALIRKTKINGETVQQAWEDMPATGQHFDVPSFAMEPGANLINSLFFRSPDGVGVPTLQGTQVTVVFHSESGATTTKTFQVND